MVRKTPLSVYFYETETGNQPCRDFILSCSQDDKKYIGSDIYLVQDNFPVNNTLVEKLDTDLWEIRSHITDGIARIIFTLDGETLVLLHGFIKKSQKTPKQDIKVAKSRLKDYRRQNK
jgi:phage-related protein